MTTFKKVGNEYQSSDKYFNYKTCKHEAIYTITKIGATTTKQPHYEIEEEEVF